jgi:hypothetical protein
MNPSIHVIATTFDGTEAALKAAIPAAIQQNARVVLLVLVQSAPADTEQSTWATRALIDKYDEMAQPFNYPVQIRLCLTPAVGRAVARLMPRNTTVFIGGPARVWWPAAEERLAASLRRREFEVVFVGCNSGRPRVRSGVRVHA